MTQKMAQTLSSTTLTKSAKLLHMVYVIISAQTGWTMVTHLTVFTECRLELSVTGKTQKIK